MAAHSDILIVGNGILGLSLGFALLEKDPTLSVTILGPPARHGGASRAAGAMINAWAELTEGQLEDAVLAERAALTLGAMPLWNDIAAALSEFAPAPLALRWGTVLIENEKSTPIARANFDAVLAALRSKTIPHELGRAVPALKPGAALTRALHLPDGAIDAQAVLAAYEASLRARGAVLLADTAIGLDTRTRSIKTAGTQQLSAEHIVLAHGSFAGDLLNQDAHLRASVPPLLFGTGYALDIGLSDARLDALTNVVRTPDRGAAPSAYLIPQSRGTYYFGATSQLSLTPDTVPPPAILASLKATLANEFDPAFMNARIALRGPGFRPVAADGFPLLGETDLTGIWLLNGMKRDGFTASPYLAQIFAAAMLTPSSNTLPTQFAPCRSLLSYKTRELAIAEAIAMEMPESPEAEHAARVRIEAIYERCGIGDFGILPELLPLYAKEKRFMALAAPRRTR